MFFINVVSIITLHSSLVITCFLSYACRQIFIRHFYFVSASLSSLRVSVIKFAKFYSQLNNLSDDALVLPVNKLLLNLTFCVDKIYHHNGVAYDYYSKDDLGQIKSSRQWKVWPLPSEINSSSSSDDAQTSSFVMSNLSFVDVIYVLTDPRLTERQNNLKKGFYLLGISAESIKWRMKWNRTTCNSDSNRIYVYQRLNLKDKPLSN